MTKARRDQVDLDVATVYHCVSRCVRRAFLCGADWYSGKCYEHRKEWIRERLGTLSEIFAIDICAYAVMSNHLHLVLRVDSSRAASWDAEEVARRHIRLHPSTQEQWALPLSVSKRAALVRLWRERLHSISWLMRGLSESIARRANREEKVQGRFWEGRFQSQAIVDERGLLACMAYVDLNPIRAAIADDFESSDFTSIQERLLERAKQSSQHRSRRSPRRLAPMAGERPGGEAVHPLPLDFKAYEALLRGTSAALEARARAEAASGDGDCERFAEPLVRDSVQFVRQGELEVPDDEQVMAESSEILAKVGIPWQGWLDALSGRQFRKASAIGSVSAFDALTRHRNRKWQRGVRIARMLTA